MKINKLGIEQMAKAGTVNSEKKKNQPKPGVKEGDVSLQVSNLVKSIQANKTETNSPAMEKKLAQLSKLIESGEYKVNAEELAQAILSAFEVGDE